MKKNQIEDLSFSGLTSQINGDTNEAKKILSNLVDELESNQQKLQKIESKRDGIQIRIAQLRQAGEDIAQHINKTLPLYIAEKDRIIIVESGDLKTEKNLL